VGVALGFGAQTLVKDWIGGFFILLERQFDVGDWVEVANVDGTVEEVNLRSTVLRSLDGARHVVSNGEIQLSSNHTRGYSRYVFELPVPYEADLDTAVQVLRSAGEELRLDPTFRDLITGPIEVLGVDRYGESSVDVKAYIETVPGEHWRVGRELRGRLKLALDAAGIDIPFPHREIIMRPAPSATDG
jgi:small conductance mechanosensitive channel